MIKDQCNNCMKQMSMTCTHQIIFNGSPCQDYAKRFDLVKHKDNVSQPIEEIQTIVNSSVTLSTTSSNDSFFKSLFSFQGRNRRSTYWFTNIGLVLFMTLVGIIGELSADSGFLAAILLIPYVWILIANYVKRFHDLGRNGWLTAFLMIPIVNCVLYFYLGFFKGQEYDNEYGPNPY